MNNAGWSQPQTGAKGNLTADKENIQYTWEFDNMLASCIVPSASTIGTVGTHTYQYDALGRRVSKTVASTTTVFVYRDQQVMAEYTSGDAASAPLREYVYGTFGRIAR